VFRKISFLTLLIWISISADSVASWRGSDAESSPQESKNTRAGVRVALVIGNGAYQDAESLPKLTNPPHDAEDVAAALRKFGFEVLSGKNLTKDAMEEVIAEFGRKARDAEAALFYFAGHGLQNKNQNYLMPVDAKVRSLASVSKDGVNLNYPLEEMENAKTRVNIVLLDACRNNPFGEFRSAGGRGLAVPGSVPEGTVIVYATGPGKTASDGQGRNGVFTAGLLDAFKGTDLSLDDVLTTASERVDEMTEHQQMPYVNGPQLVKKHFRFSGSSNPTVIAQVAPPAVVPAFQAPAPVIQPPAEPVPSHRKTKPQAKAKPVVGTSPIHGRYLDNGDGTVADIVNKLRWKRCAEGQTWTGNTCAGEVKAYKWDDLPKPSDGWRVPTVEEAKTLLYCKSTKKWGESLAVTKDSEFRPNEFEERYVCGKEISQTSDSPSIDQDVFVNSPLWTWTSSEYSTFPGFTWVVNFFDGYVYYYNQESTSPVRLVRTSQ